jgi:hypothetical protein
MERKVFASLVIIFLVMALPLASIAEDNRRDGNWWQGQLKSTKLAYLTGLFDGMELGYNFASWNFIHDKQIDPCVSQMTKSFNERRDNFLKNVTNDQLVYVLDSFYEDYRNRRIMVNDAVWLIANNLAGTPSKALDTMLENFRRNANP